MPEKNCRYVYVYNKTRETFLALRVKIADTVLDRMVGLLGKRTLEPEGGVWIVPCNSVHTVGMLFRIDALFIDKQLKVVSVRELLRPFWVTAPIFRAESVIELPAYTIFKSGTQVGDQLEIERYAAAPGVSAQGRVAPPVVSLP
jgi:uncharacterized protein